MHVGLDSNTINSNYISNVSFNEIDKKISAVFPDISLHDLTFPNLSNEKMLELFNCFCGQERIPFHPLLLKLIEVFLQDKSEAEIKKLIAKVSPSILPHFDFIFNALQYGYKVANLFILKQFGTVPPFIAISNGEIQTYLSENLPQINVLWEEFILLQGNEKYLNSTAKQKLYEIENLILDHFKSHIFDHPNIKKFLQKYSKSLLMVRSTGKEDSDTQANPGGNKSAAAVLPCKEAISCAMGEVVSSYYSAKSIEQRLIGQDNICAKPFLPLLIQVMIGETVNGEKIPEHIPLAGVIYTQEMEGSTSGLTEIDVAFGHNEGVVAGMVPFDTFYIGEGQTHQAIIRNKFERIVPVDLSETGKVQLVKQEMPSEIKRKPALSESLRFCLKQAAEKIHRYYGKTMDIEWVYDPKIDTVYLVQARPIALRRTEAKPGILNLSHIEKSKLSAGCTIVASGGSLRVISTPDELILASTLKEALDLFLAQSQSKVKAVICERMAAATSHEAGLFREAGIAVLCVPRSKELFSKWNYKETFLVVDPQQQLLLMDKKTPEMSEALGNEIAHILKEDHFILDGWFKHPIAGQETILNLKFSESEIEELWNLLQPSDLQQFDKYRKMPLKELLQRVAMHKSVADFSLALTAVLQQVYHKAVQLHKTGLDERIVPLIRHIFRVADTLTKSHDEMQFLHAYTRLETALFQPGDPSLVDGFSMYQILQEEKAAESVDISRSLHFTKGGAGFLTSKQMFGYLAQFRKVGKFALEPGLRKNWESFTAAIAFSGSRVANGVLAHLLKSLREHHLLELWLNLSFKSAFIKSQDPLKVLKILLEEMAESHDLNGVIRKKRQIMQRWESRIDDWSDPQRFSLLWKSFQEEFIPALLDPAHIEILKSSGKPNLSKLLLIQFIEEAVEVYDKTIKSMKNSPEWTLKDKKGLQGWQFMEMLVPYEKLMEDWVRTIPEEQMNIWYSSSALSHTNAADIIIYIRRRFAVLKVMANAFWKGTEGRFSELDKWEARQLSVTKKVKKISKSDRKRLSEMLFFPSENFVVSSARIGSGASFDRQFNIISEEITLEDLFSLFHQNIKVCVSWQKSQLGLTLKHLPEALQSLYLACEEGGVGALMGINLHYPIIQLDYNIPLRNHSGNLKVLYDLEKKESTLTLDFYGYNRFNRMEVMAARAVLDSILDDLDLETIPDYNPKRYIFSVAWRVPDEQKVANLIKLIKKLSCITSFEYKEMQDAINEEEYLNKGILYKIDEQNKQLLKNLDIKINLPKLRNHLNI